mgnify:CR=1 FL=1
MASTAVTYRKVTAVLYFRPNTKMNVNGVSCGMGKSSLFTSSKYATRGVASEVAIDVQLVLWSLVENMRNTGAILDYLQIFELSMDNVHGKPTQKIIHRQEQPEFHDTHYFNVSEIYRGKIWVIDSVEYVTMLFPKEY